MKLEVYYHQTLKRSLDEKIIRSMNAWSKYQTITRSTNHKIKYSFEHMVTWSYDHMIIWSHGHMITWSHDHMITWSHDHMIKWSHDHMITWSHDHMITWLNDYTKIHFIKNQIFLQTNKTSTKSNINKYFNYTMTSFSRRRAMTKINQNTTKL